MSHLAVDVFVVGPVGDELLADGAEAGAGAVRGARRRRRPRGGRGRRRGRRRRRGVRGPQRGRGSGCLLGLATLKNMGNQGGNFVVRQKWAAG